MLGFFLHLKCGSFSIVFNILFSEYIFTCKFVVVASLNIILSFIKIILDLRTVKDQQR